MRACLIALAFTALTPAIARAEPVRVVASFSILGDFVRQVGGDDVSVTTLVGPDGDVHVYEPKPADLRAIAGARLVVENGLGLEGWMDRLAKAAAYKGPVVVATTGIKPLTGPEGFDPHAWQSALNAKTYVANIASALEAADSSHAAAYRDRAALYAKKLDDLDAAIHAASAGIPEKDRVVLTTHDAFGYFGRAYGVTFLAPEGFSTESTPSAATIAALIDQIKTIGVKAVFIENMTDHRLVDQIAHDTGVDVSGVLYSDALSPPDGPAATYLDMMTYNSGKLFKAMRRN